MYRRPAQDSTPRRRHARGAADRSPNDGNQDADLASLRAHLATSELALLHIETSDDSCLYLVTTTNNAHIAVDSLEKLGIFATVA